MQNPRLRINGTPTIKCSRTTFLPKFKEYLIEKGFFSEEEIKYTAAPHLAKLVRGITQVNRPPKSKWSRRKDVFFLKMLYMTDDFSYRNMKSLMDSICDNDLTVKKNTKDREKAAEYTHHIVIGNSLDKSFYTSSEWLRLRYRAFDLYGNMCQCCGRTPKDGIVLHVDHVVPRVLKPDLALDIENLQILCELCNLGKRADYITDWRNS